MTLLNLEEKAMVFNFMPLTSQVVLVLEDAEAGKELNDKQCSILRKGSDLLSRIIEGATLVEGKDFKEGLSPSIEGLSIYEYALSTLRKLELTREIEGFTEYFENYDKELTTLCKNRKKDGINIQKLENFFFALGRSLSSDIQKEDYLHDKESIEKQLQYNGQ